MGNSKKILYVSLAIVAGVIIYKSFISNKDVESKEIEKSSSASGCGCGN